MAGILPVTWDLGKTWSRVSPVSPRGAATPIGSAWPAAGSPGRAIAHQGPWSEGLIPRGAVMKTPSLVLLILGLAMFSTAHAQVSREWVARYASATPWNDVPYAMTVDAAGCVYVTGTTATPGTNDWATIKYNPAGVQDWLRTLNGGGADAAAAITTDDAGNVYVTGSSGGGLYSMTAKYSADGDQLWVQSFTTIGEGDAGIDIAVDHQGNVYVTGYNVAIDTGF